MLFRSSRFLLPQWSLPETRGWQVRVGSASQPCRADAIPTLQMGTPRLAEVKGPAWDSRPDSRGCRHSSSVPPPLWKMGLWFSSPRPLKEETCPSLQIHAPTSSTGPVGLGGLLSCSCSVCNMGQQWASAHSYYSGPGFFRVRAGYQRTSSFTFEET